MRLVLIVGNTYEIYEDRSLIAQFESNEPIWPDQVEALRTGDYDDKEKA